jgi:hypothetical protein
MTRSWLWLGAVLMATPAAAQTVPDYDSPVKIVTIPASGDQDAITCTAYADVMVRISGTDTPDPDNALLLPPAPCGAGKPQGVTLASQGESLDGRKGGFLVFEDTDPNGASGFTVFDAHTGRQLFTDGMNAIQAVTLDAGVLHVRYTRGVNATCSLFADRAGCWGKLLASGAIPHGAFAVPPSCAAYRQGTVPADDPSVVSYDAALTLDRQGHAVVQPTGPLHCDPMP